MSPLESMYQLPKHRFSTPLTTATATASSLTVSRSSTSPFSLDRMSATSSLASSIATTNSFPLFPIIPNSFFPAAFPNGWLLEQHTILQHSGQSNRKSHTPERGEEKPFQCDQCGQSYRYRSAYVKHREQNHRARLPADKLFTCDICGMQFRYLKSFKKHRLNHSLEMIQPSTSGSQKREAVKSTSAMEETPPKTEQDVEIDEEGEVEGKRTRVVSESRVSSSNEVEASQTSDVAGGSSSSTVSKDESVDSLALALTGGEPTLFNLLRYPSDRQRERQLFACSFCSKTVRSKENLKLHVRKHTGERPFACMFCGRAFGGKSDLTRHVRIHTGERPYHCEMCGKCFARADYLSKHLTTHLHNTHPRVATSE